MSILHVLFLLSRGSLLRSSCYWFVMLSDMFSYFFSFALHDDDDLQKSYTSFVDRSGSFKDSTFSSEFGAFKVTKEDCFRA